MAYDDPYKFRRDPGIPDHAINRVLRSHLLPPLESPGVVVALAGIVEDHQHFMELLRACEPNLRRDMYESMSPYLKFKALPLETYIIMAKERAEGLPVLGKDV